MDSGGMGSSDGPRQVDQVYPRQVEMAQPTGLVQRMAVTVPDSLIEVTLVGQQPGIEREQLLGTADAAQGVAAHGNEIRAFRLRRRRGEFRRQDDAPAH